VRQTTADRQSELGRRDAPPSVRLKTLVPVRVQTASVSEPSRDAPLASEYRRRLSLQTRAFPHECVGCDLPALSIVVPVRLGGGLPTACACFGSSAVPVARFELLVARGLQPSAQRNALVRVVSANYKRRLCGPQAPSQKKLGATEFSLAPLQFCRDLFGRRLFANDIRRFQPPRNPLE
jgi:hypothetical protein